MLIPYIVAGLLCVVFPTTGLIFAGLMLIFHLVPDPPPSPRERQGKNDWRV